MRLWRILFATQAKGACDPVRNPEGRFHHDGQSALYAALTPEGAGASITRYLGADDPPRVIVGLALTGGAILDLDEDATDDRRRAAMHRWDRDRAAGVRPVTWDLSDVARRDGFDGLLYPSRLRPDLRNIVLFRWNAGDAPTLCVEEKRRAWP